jgi:hypothetical protein
MLAMVIRLLQMNQLEIPSEWASKLIAARTFLAELRRPDGSIPVFGNTDYLEHVVPAELGRVCSEPPPPCLDSGIPPAKAFSLYSGAGYAIWWSGLADWPHEDKLSQTVIVWSYYKGHGHKLADEMSALLWSKGTQWVTNVGYWPYDEPHRDAATGWSGGNGPHLTGETASGDRETILRHFSSFSSADAARVIDLERIVAKGEVRLRRQILAVEGNLWLVLDSSEGRSASTETVWTFGPALSLARHQNIVSLTAQNGLGSMVVTVTGSGNPRVGEYRGSLSPFAGWVVQKTQPMPAPAIVVGQASPATWTLTTFALSDDARENSLVNLPVTKFISAEQWQTTLKSPKGAVRVARSGPVIEVTGVNGTKATLTLSPGASLITGRKEIEAAFAKADARYPKFRDLYNYRIKILWVIAFGVLLQEGIILLIRSRAKHLVSRIRLLATAAWFGFAAWVGVVYLV